MASFDAKGRRITWHPTTTDSGSGDRRTVALCDKAVEDFKIKRGNTIWDIGRRDGPSTGRGSIRGAENALDSVATLCGVSADERALDVDTSSPASTVGRTTRPTCRPLLEVQRG